MSAADRSDGEKAEEKAGKPGHKCIFSHEREIITAMREIRRRLDACRTRIGLLCGRDLVIVVNRGRNKVERFRGRIQDMYEAVFTVKDSEDKLNCCSYSDVLTKNIKFFNGETESQA